MIEPGGERPGRWPAAYLITFSCYGARVHAEDRATVDKLHDGPGAPFVAEHSGRAYVERLIMADSPYLLGRTARDTVLEAVRAVCHHRAWILHAAQVRRSHVHLVVAAQRNPADLLRDFKAYSSRALNRLESSRSRPRHWARHGSTRWLWDQTSVRAATEYVLHGQGDPLAVWPTRPPR